MSHGGMLLSVSGKENRMLLHLSRGNYIMLQREEEYRLKGANQRLIRLVRVSFVEVHLSILRTNSSRVSGIDVRIGKYLPRASWSLSESRLS